jgi:N-acetylglucosamine-6-sulfatase
VIVTSGYLPYGGWKKFLDEKLNDNYLPTWIQNAGIRTYYAGKLLNGLKFNNRRGPTYPKSWTASSILMDPWTYFYYDSKWTDGFGGSESYKGQHTTDVTQQKALAMLDDAATSGDQFFLMVAPVAPHQDLQHGVSPPPVPAKYQGVFADQKAPRTENFNPDVASGASWVSKLPKLNEKKLKNCDKTFGHRLGNIAAIDDMVGELVQRLDDHGILNNTYIIYTSDNGTYRYREDSGMWLIQFQASTLAITD